VANATLLNSVQQKAYFNFLIATRVRAHSAATTQFRKSLLAKFSNGLGDFLWGGGEELTNFETDFFMFHNLQFYYN